MNFKRIIVLVVIVAAAFCPTVSASPGNLALSRSPIFAESPVIKPRVRFWIDIFTRYDENQMVFHHRDYPHVIFEVFDYSREAKERTPRRLEEFKKIQKQRHIGTIKAAFQRLAAGRSPSSPLEKSIVTQMRSIPGGTAKYKKVVNEGLIRAQTGIRDKFEQAIIRSGRYMPTLERIFADHGLQVELTRLPFVESSFDYKAYSAVGAAGIWQFMPRTARLFNLKISSALDERRDPVEATKAAARYLIQAYNELGTWPLALTSYNHGIYGVKKAVRKMGTTDIERIVEFHGKRVFGFASNNFYAEFLAALEVYENYQNYFPGIKIENPLRFEEVPLANSYSINFITKQLGVSQDELAPLNYALSKLAYTGKVFIPKGYSLKVPHGVAPYAKKLKLADAGRVAPERSASSLYGGATHRVREDEDIEDVARRYKTTVADIVALNKLEKAEVRQGQYLVVKKKEVAPATQGSIYIVRKGDSLSRIASKFRISLGSLIKHNRLKSQTIKPGQRIRIPGKTLTASNSRPQREDLREGKVYKVRKGDNLWKIGKRYGVSVDKLKKTNHLGSSELRVGDSLIIP